jgi:3-hydroxybutyryl-CoA dehydratase
VTYQSSRGRKSIFGSRVAHGMLVGSLISTVIGTKLPGSGAIYLEQNLKFKKPVYIGDTVIA